MHDAEAASENATEWRQIIEVTLFLNNTLVSGAYPALPPVANAPTPHLKCLVWNGEETDPQQVNKTILGELQQY